MAGTRMGPDLLHFATLGAFGPWVLLTLGGSWVITPRVTTTCWPYRAPAGSCGANPSSA